MTSGNASGVVAVSDDHLFRHQLWSFLQHNQERPPTLPRDWARGPDSSIVLAGRSTQRVLYAAGYVGMTWPWRYGGRNGIGAPVQDDEVADVHQRDSLTNGLDGASGLVSE